MHNNICKNGCEFAKKFHLMSYANKNADGTYSDDDYLYTCTILGHTVSFDTTIYKLGCGSFSNACQNARVMEAEALVAEVEKKLDEIEKVIPVITPELPVPEPAVAPAAVSETPAELPVIPTVVERTEPKFVPEPTVDVPIHNVVVEKAEKPKTDTTKKRGRRTGITASVVNPVVPEVTKV